MIKALRSNDMKAFCWFYQINFSVKAFIYVYFSKVNIFFFFLLIFFESQFLLSIK